MSILPDKNKKLGQKEGDPIYGDKKDIFEQDKKAGVDPDDVTADDTVAEDEEIQDLHDEMDQGLDVPGAELDDPAEAVGEEDEENNYYSLGGDDHEDLDEDNDDED